MSKTIILVPTYYGSQMVQNCINSIYQNVPNPMILAYKNDLGWLKACNEMITATKGDVILLNDDTLVLTDIVTAMTELAYSSDEIAIVGGKTLAPNTETILNYGIYISPDGNTGHKYYGEQRASVKVEKQRAVEGSLMFIKREVINRVGLFEEKYGMGYRAEVAYCFKARELGWKIMSTPDAEAVHFSHQTAGRLGIKNDTHEIFMEDWGTKLQLGEV